MGRAPGDRGRFTSKASCGRCWCEATLTTTREAWTRGPHSGRRDRPGWRDARSPGADPPPDASIGYERSGDGQGTALYVAYGNGQIGPLDNGVPSPYDPDGSIERDVAVQSAAFVLQLGALHIPVTVDAYGNGTHNWTYCARDLHRWLPLALKALGEKP